MRGKCVERVRECPRGTVLRNGRCVVVEPERCPRGTVGTPPNCRKLRISPDLQRLFDPTQKQRQQVSLDIRRAYLDYKAAQERLKAAEAQKTAADAAVEATQARYRVGAATLVELSQSRAAQVQAASALVNARYTLVFQDALMSYYTGELEPGSLSLGN